MKLRLIKYNPLFAYSVGDQFEVNEADTKTLLDGNFAVPAGQKVDKVENAESKEKKQYSTSKAQR